MHDWGGDPSFPLLNTNKEEMSFSFVSWDNIMSQLTMAFTPAEQSDEEA